VTLHAAWGGQDERLKMLILSTLGLGKSLAAASAAGRTGAAATAATTVGRRRRGCVQADLGKVFDLEIRDFELT
jgi:hypothetical protein